MLVFEDISCRTLIVCDTDLYTVSLTSSYEASFRRPPGRAFGGGGGWGTYRKAKPREDGPVETIFGDPPKAVFEGGGHLR